MVFSGTVFSDVHGFRKSSEIKHVTTCLVSRHRSMLVFEVIPAVSRFAGNAPATHALGLLALS
jgi:hypothetical protein